MQEKLILAKNKLFEILATFSSLQRFDIFDFKRSTWIDMPGAGAPEWEDLHYIWFLVDNLYYDEIENVLAAAWRIYIENKGDNIKIVNNRIVIE